MNILKWLFILGGAGLLNACGGSSGDGTGGPEDVDYSHLRWSSPSAEPLTNAHSANEVSDYWRNGVRVRIRGGSTDGVAEDDNAAVPESGDAASDGDFSRTNVHVEGVDESDRLKYDGHHLFVAETPEYSYARIADDVVDEPSSDSGDTPELPVGEALRIFAADPEEGTAEALFRFDLTEYRDGDSVVTLSDLYTVESDGQAEEVVALSDSYMTFGGGNWVSAPFFDVAILEGQTRLEWVDVLSPANPSMSGSMELEGSLLNSRKIGDTLYLVSRAAPAMEGLNVHPSSHEEQVENERLIAETPIADMLPGYRVDDGETRALVSESDCYLPENLAADEGYADIVTVSAIDLRTRELAGSVCISAQLSGLYMSQDSLYLGSHASDGDAALTALHKFVVDGGDIEYRGSGQVSGALKWSDPSFSLDEYEDHLRVVTTERENWDNPTHYLHVLREPRDGEPERELQTVARLPNENEPAPIGKPGEEIYGVRFLGERGYIVTFERIDPLYVLDLSDHQAPRVLGELEIPGVSDYLHPVGAGYLVSVGREADELGRLGGIKVDLYDVRDESAPEQLASEVIGGAGSWSEAVSDLRAFNFLPTGEDQLRFTIPVTRYEEYRWQDSGLYPFEVNGLSGDGPATLDPVAPLIAESSDNTQFNYPASSGSARSRLHDDTLFYLHGNDIWTRFWDQPDTLTSAESF